MALDLYISGCAGTPVTAAVMAFGANFLIWMIDLMEGQVSMAWLSECINFISLYHRNEPFLMGQFSWAGVLYEISFVLIFLGMTVHHLERRRRG